jgi:hypothetical protein
MNITIEKTRSRSDLVGEPADVERPAENDVRRGLSNTCKGIFDPLCELLLIENFQDVRPNQYERRSREGFTEYHLRHSSASLRFQTAGLADLMSKSRRMLVQKKTVKGASKGDKVYRFYLRVRYVTSRRVLHPTIRWR